MERSRFKATIQYVGSRYHGWQIQRQRPTVQGVMKDVLAQLAGEKVSITGASRTDAGVHAIGQVAHFDFPLKPTIGDLRKALNGTLPWDIRVVRLKRVRPTFHAQKDAKKKRYRYRIFNGPVLPPFEYGRALHVRRPMNVERILEAAQCFLGTHDFTSFAAASTSVKTKTRTILKSDIRRRGFWLTYQVEANGFLHHMIRNIVGTLVEIGTGRRASHEIQRLIAAQDRTLVGPTAPPDGLFLVHIWY